MRYLIGSARRNDIAAVQPGAGAEVDNVIGFADSFLIVLNNDDRISEIAEIFQRREQFPVVALVKADAGFVEYI